jgi:hypothetical protein
MRRDERLAARFSHGTQQIVKNCRYGKACARPHAARPRNFARFRNGSDYAVTLSSSRGISAPCSSTPASPCDIAGS